MSKPDSGIWHTVVFAIVFLFIAGWYFKFFQKYPYYFIWSMDLTVVQDALLIQGGSLPAHIHHPSFGLYLLLFLTLKLSYHFGLISVLAYGELRHFLHPYLGFVECLELIRIQSVGIALIIGLLFYWMFSLWNGQKKSFLSLLVFIFISTPSSTLYHVTMIRSEFYAVFFWVIAVFTLYCATGSKSPARRHLWMGIAGISLGLSLFTKVQAFFYVVSAPFIFLFLRETHGGRLSEPPRSNEVNSHPPLAGFMVALSNLMIFILLITYALQSEPPPNLAYSASRPFSLFTPVCVTFFVLFSTPVLSEICLSKLDPRKRYFHALKQTKDLSFDLSFLWSGFLFAIGMHLLLYRNFSQGFSYLLYDVQMVFLRSLDQSYAPLKTIYEHFLYNPGVFLLHGIALGLVWRSLKNSPRKLPTKGSILSLSSMAFLNVAWGTRVVLRDTIWVDVFLNFLSISYLFLYLQNEKTAFLKTLRVALLLSLAILYNIWMAQAMPARIDSLYNVFGFWENRYFHSWFYPSDQKFFGDFFYSRYQFTDGTKSVAKNTAKSLQEIKRTMDFVFKNQHVPLSHIGIVHENFPVWVDDLDFKIRIFSDKLRDSILVDNRSVKRNKRYFFNRNEVIEHHDTINKFLKQPPEDAISILPRRDLRIFLFVDKHSALQLLKQDAVDFADFPQIVIDKFGETHPFYGIEIKDQTVADLRNLERYFFVILKSG